MRWKYGIPVLFLATFYLYSCEPANGDLPQEVMGVVPVYSKDNAYKNISSVAARPTVKAGKIYTTGSLLLQVELDSGIHVINYADPVHPQKIGFIRSFLCKEVSMKNGFIYTNNFSDLVVIDISNPTAAREIGRVAAVFPDLALQYPPEELANNGTIYFECPDPSKGYIIRWESKTLNKPKCRR